MSLPTPTDAQAAQIAAAAGQEQPYLLLPDAGSLFADRARRFSTLASKHPQGDWLRFLAELTGRQQQAMACVAEAPLPTAAALEQARTHAMPPLTSAGWTRDARWQQALAMLLDGLQAHLPAAAHGVIARLQQASAAELEQLADGVLGFALDSDADRAAGVFIGAALQVYWTALAARLDHRHLARPESKGVCPCCGSLPVASLVRVGSSASGDANLRYLHCSLCNSEWNLVRITCAHCEDNAKVAYQSLEGLESDGGGEGVPSPAVRGETCDACHSYLKIIYQEKDPLADPVADDLATLTLDLLLDEAGYQRCGPNLLLLPGASA